jgi:hypothetical protein
MNDWHLVNLFVPTLLPLVFLAAFFLFDLSKAEKARANPLVAIKDGQLSWAGLGMCVQGLYELHHPSAGGASNEPWLTTTFWLLIAVMLLHVFIAAVGPVFPTRRRENAGVWKTVLHYRVLITSASLTVGAAGLYSSVHLTTQACGTSMN